MDIRNHEKIVKQIAKTSDLIRKKCRALKTGKMDEDIALEKHFKPIVEPLKQIVENTVGEEFAMPKIEKLPSRRKKYDDDNEESTIKRQRSIAPFDESTIKRQRSNVPFSDSLMTSTPIASPLNETVKTLQPRQLLYERTLPVDDVFETPPSGEPLVTPVRQTSERQKIQAQYGPLGQKYMEAVLSGEKDGSMDNVYGVYFINDEAMMGNKHINLDKNDDIVIDGKRYAGTPGLYELIFRKIPVELYYTNEDLQNYKSILLATNAHKRDHNEHSRVKGNRGLKYKNIIAPLLSEKSGKGLPRAMILNDNQIDYVHWDDPNELVDRLRLLEASRRAGHNAHDNEILSIIEELREAGIIIN